MLKPSRPSVSLDDTDRRILERLAGDGRRPAADLAKELGLSRQAVAERLRALEERKVIRGYRVDVDPAALGLTVRAQIRMTLDGRRAEKDEQEVLRRLRGNPMVRSVYRVSGEDCVVVQVLCSSIEDVAALLSQIQSTHAIQSTRTAFVLEVLAEKDPLGAFDVKPVSKEID